MGALRFGVLSLRALSLRALALATLLGCSDTTGGSAAELSEDEVRLGELEGLSFVPSGRTFIGSPLDVGSPVDLLVDRFEVRQVLWDRWVGAGDPVPSVYRPGASSRDRGPRPLAWTAEVPAVGMTLSEARSFAELRGLRLPTFDEWLWCAVGPTCRRTPAGRRQRGFANTLDTDLLRPTPVGSFESGQTPETGIYDMLGNVWEWIEPPPDRARSWWRVWNDTAWDDDSARRAPTWVLGGSFMTQEGPLYTRGQQLLALAATEGQRSSEIGFRCCVDADVYLGDLPSGGSLSKPVARRLEAVGRRWGSRSTSLLEELLEASPNHGWLRALLRGARGKSAQ